MRGQQERSGSLFSYVSIEETIPASHPLRRIRKLAYQALDRLIPTFCGLFAVEGRPSVPPEQLLLDSLLQAFYGICSERFLLEQLHYNLLFRWFVGMSPDDPIWHPTTFTKNSERLLNNQVMCRFLNKVMAAPKVKPQLCDKHFLVDGTLLQAWHPMPRWSKSMVRMICRHHLQALARALVSLKKARNERKAIVASSSSAIRPTAPVRIPTRCCAANPKPTPPCRATGAMC
jgi:transposase